MDTSNSSKTSKTATVTGEMSRMRISPSTNSTAAAGTNDTQSKSSASSSPSFTYVAERFPINTIQQITLLPNNEIVIGRVYCTDEITRTVVLQKSLLHTTLSCDIRIISVNSIAHSKRLPEKGSSSSNGTAADSDSATATRTTTTTGATADTIDQMISTVRATPLSASLPILQKKVIDERERRAMKLAEESLRHINPKASPLGQAVFERLLKACGEVAWKTTTNRSDTTTSIIVLNNIQVDAPYLPENCTIIKTTTNSSSSNNGGTGTTTSTSTTTLEDVSLDRVKKIVASAISSSADTINNNSTTTSTTTATATASTATS